MKKLMNLKGAKILSKKEQKSIIGGITQQECELQGGVWYDCIGPMCLIGIHLPPC